MKRIARASLLLLPIVAFSALAGTVNVSPVSGLQTSEGGQSATFTIVLSSAPTADVSVALSSSDTTEGTVAPASVTFTPANFSQPQTVTITGVNDDSVDGNLLYSIVTAAAVSADPGYNGVNASDVSVINNDDDVARVNITPTQGLVTTESGGTATFTVALSSRPAADVIVRLSSSNTAEGTVAPAVLTFTPAGGLATQAVTVTGVDDSDLDGEVAYAITIQPLESTDTLYNGLDPADVLVTNTNNDSVPTATIATTSPAFGETAGGMLVTITGANFLTGATVRFGTTPAAAASILSSTLILAEAPAHAVGLVSISVTNVGGTAGSVSNAFNYNDPPVLSELTAAPNPGFVEEEVTFTLSAATDPEGSPVTVTYSYGDGTSDGSGKHTYLAAETYTVTVSASDGLYTVQETLSLVVNGKISMMLGKLGGKTSFVKQNTDQVQAAGILPNLPAGFDPVGKIFKINCGGATDEFTLAAKGKGKTATGSVALKIRLTKNKATKTKQFLGGSIGFKVKFGKNTWSDDWLDEGIDPNNSPKKAPMPIRTEITLDGRIYTELVTTQLSGKAKKSAKFAFKRKLPKI